MNNIGNTPTCVGKTLLWRIDIYLNRKHPHVRGEDTRKAYQLLSQVETPPRAWGRRRSKGRRRERLGNTPTCVGKTPQWRLVVQPLGKHPHVRGEDVIWQSLF